MVKQKSSMALVLGLIVLVLSGLKPATAAEIAKYAGLSAGLQKSYQIIEKKNNVEIRRQALYTMVLPKRTMENNKVAPVKVTYEGLSSKDKMKWSVVEYMLLSADKLEKVATKFPNDARLYKGNEVVLKAPLNVGVTWKTGQYEKVVAGKNEKIKVPAGAFSDCLKIKTTRTIDGKMVYEETAWYAPEMGQIKTIIAYPQESTQFLIQVTAVPASKPDR